MGDGIFVTNNESKNLILSERINYIDNIDGVNVYSFSTFDSLKEYTEINNMAIYTNESIDKLFEQHEKNVACKKINNFVKLRDSLKKEKNLEQDLDISIKIENLDEEYSKSSYSLIWQPEIYDNVSYDYDNSNTASKFIKKSNCGKEHCNYGCICETISNPNTITRDHCGRYECIFKF